jgi:hypothetical protein
MLNEHQDRILGTTHVFVLRVWVEIREEQSAEPAYRLVVEHVRSEKRHALTDINQLPALILSYFEKNPSEEQGV